MSITQAWLGHHKARLPAEPVPKFTCADGFTFSIQASQYHYCDPRQNTGPWSAVELGYPSALMPGLASYCEDETAPLATVYPYVPVSLVDDVIREHGGMCLELARSCPKLALVALDGL